MLHKRVTTENHSNSWAEFGTQKARIQRRRNPNLRGSLCFQSRRVLAVSYVAFERKNTHVEAYELAVNQQLLKVVKQPNYNLHKSIAR